MTKVFKSDLYRFGKSKLFYGIVAFTGVIAFLLTMLIRQDIRIGISVFGDLTAFKNAHDIIRIGTEYHKSLGILVAILISVFIGQEYQWETWQNKWITCKSRFGIYFSKSMISIIVSVLIFLIFEVVSLISSDQIQETIANGYIATIVCGVFIYAALGATICLLSMTIKNITASTIACICYVMFSETLVSVIANVSNFSESSTRFIGWIIRHSIYGMSTIISSTSISADISLSIIINSLVIMLLSTTVGLMIFRKYEL